MKKKSKILCFDLDNVICTTKKNYYRNSKPKKEVIKFINSLHDKGYFIKIFTARFMGRYNSKKIAENKGYDFTLKQLNKWGLKFDQLIFGKPSFDIYIDDKNLEFSKNWTETLQKYLDE